MNDEELSLAVVKIILPDVGSYTWKTFDYTTDDALGKMCAWLADENRFGSLGNALIKDDKHKALAEAIVEASK